MCCPKKGISRSAWSEAVLLGSWFYKHFVPPGLKTESLLVTRTLETAH